MELAKNPWYLLQIVCTRSPLRSVKQPDLTNNMSPGCTT